MLTSVISAVIYLLLTFGIAILLRKPIARVLAKALHRWRLDPERSPGGAKRFRLSDHITQLLTAVMKKPISSTSFMVLSIIVFFVVFTVSAKNLSMAISMFTAAAFSGLPYLFLRMRLERIRRKGSFEGEKLMAAFLAQYYISGANIYETIEKVIGKTESLKVTGSLLVTLLITIRNTGSPERIKGATDSFAYSIGTSWASMLAYSIRIAAISGTNVAGSLEDILSQLKDARKLAETRKRLNGESVRMAFFLTPALYVGSILVCLLNIGLRPAELLHNQFFTPEGFSLITMAVFLYFLNSVLLDVFTNKKLDY
jgi:hypothetical protein